MKQNSMTVWETLLSKQMVAGEKPTLELASPWYIKLLLSLSGWFGALFLVIFTGGMLVIMMCVSIDRYPGILGLIGAGLVFFAYTMF